MLVLLRSLLQARLLIDYMLSYYIFSQHLLHVIQISISLKIKDDALVKSSLWI
jgi:hypothetical protein